MPVKQLNFKNTKYFLSNDLIDIRNFDPNLLRLDKIESANGNIYSVNYVRKNPVEHLDPIYLFVKELYGFITQENSYSKYLNILLVDANEDFLTMYKEIWVAIKEEIKKIYNGVDGEYDKDYMKIKFDSDDDDDLPLNKIMKFRTLIIVIRHVFERNGKYYPQIFLNGCLYEI